MPLLKYRCNNCKKVFEELVSGDAPKVSCPNCQSKDVERHYQGKCTFGMKGSNAGTGCSGSCSTCSGCK